MARDVSILILLYHRLGDPPRGARIPGQFVTPARFRRHLAFLRGRGYEGVPLMDLRRPRAELPARPVVITFDDGYRSLYQQAAPALAEYGFPATIFMVSGGIGRENYWEVQVGDTEAPMLRASELREMRRAGITFGSHTVNHPHLTGLPAAQVREELVTSRARLEEVLGEPCLTLAYPYGDWNQPVRDAAAEAGYEIACTTVRAAAGPEDDLLALPRINVRRHNVTAYLAYKMQRARRAAR